MHSILRQVSTETAEIIAVEALSNGLSVDEYLRTLLPQSVGQVKDERLYTATWQESASEFFNNLGTVLAKLAEKPALPDRQVLKQAEDAFLKAIELNPRNRGARKNLGDLYLSINRLDDAETQYLATVRLDPRNADAREAVSRIARQRYSPGPPDDPKEQARIQDTLKFLDNLLEEGDEEEQRQTFALLKKYLEEDRLSDRPLFSE